MGVQTPHPKPQLSSQGIMWGAERLSSLLLFLELTLFLFPPPGGRSCSEPGRTCGRCLVPVQALPAPLSRAVGVIQPLPLSETLPTGGQGSQVPAFSCSLLSPGPRLPSEQALLPVRERLHL
jgi:hypothetical protein